MIGINKCLKEGVKMTNDIGKRIKIKREELGLTQEDLAKRMGYKSKSTINKIELGINDITQSTIIKFTEVLNTTPAYLMGWEEEQEYIDGAEEARLIKKYNKLSKSNRKVVLDLIDSLISAQQNNK